MTAQQLKNAILQEAIQGRLVPQDPNDEPASVLLDRIRKEKQQLVKEGKLKKKDLVEKSISEDEKPFEIPESWEWVRIPDIGISQLGKTKNPHQLSGLSLPYLCSINVYWEGINLSQTKEMLFEESEIDKYSIKKGDLLICEGGDCGRSAIWDKENTILYQNALHRVRFFCNIDSKYILNCLYLYKTSNQLDDYIKGETIKHLVKGELDSILFPLPPLAEQKRIVAKIEELLPKVEVYGKAQEKLNKLNEELPERLKKSILQEAIEGRLVPQDPNDEPASALLAKIREEKKQLVKEGKLKKKDLEEKPISEEEIPFSIPDSWEWVRLQSVMELINGRAYKKDELSDKGKYKVLRVGNLFTNESWYYSNLELPEDKYCYNGDLLYAWSASFGPHIWDGEKTIFHYHIWNVKYNERVLYREYLYYFFLFDKLKIKASTTGSTMIHVSMENMKPRLMPLPPLAEQYRIVEKIEQLFKSIDKLKK